MDKIHAFYGYQSPLSNFHMGQPFYIDGEKYRRLLDTCLSLFNRVSFSVEQYAQAQKAAMFGDEEAKNSIMLTWKPLDALRLGHMVTNFDINQWTEA